MRDFTDDLKDVSRRLGEAKVYLKIDAQRDRFRELEIEVSKPGLWDDQEFAKKLNAEYANTKGDIDIFDGLARRLEDAEVLHEMAREIDDASQEAEIEKGIQAIARELNGLEMRSLFTGEHDELDCIVHINTKDGGVDAQDWSELLLRMYQRWAERRGIDFEINGLMTSERGTHRLVRISPFDNQGRRQTSFSNVQVWPAMENPDIEIDETDVRMEVFRASGAGGQHVNKTSSAVRLIHEPTGLVSSSQEERSQLQNREKAMNRLKAMVAAKIEEEHQAELDRIAGKQATVGWGSQIRSYVLQPYQMVKDLRTNIESSSVESVLDGDLDEFMVGYLQWRRAGDDS